MFDNASELLSSGSMMLKYGYQCFAMFGSVLKHFDGLISYSMMVNAGLCNGEYGRTTVNQINHNG